HLLGGVDVAGLGFADDCLRAARHRADRASALGVDQLRVDVARAAEHGHARTRAARHGRGVAQLARVPLAFGFVPDLALHTHLLVFARLALWSSLAFGSLRATC